MAFLVASFVLVIFVADYVHAFPKLHKDHVKHLKSILHLHEGFTKGPIDPKIPDEFKNHSGVVSTINPVCSCNYADNNCHFSGETVIIFSGTVNNETQVIHGPVTINGDPGLNIVNIVSSELVGTKCLYFSTYSNSEDISFAVSLLHGRDETTTPVRGNRNSVKKITIGVETSTKPYKIVFRIYGFGKNGTVHEQGRPDSGIGIIGKVIIVDGPCSADKNGLECGFDYTLCHWALHDRKYIWYPLPFGLHHTLKHTIEWGALAAFAGKGNLWSPVVRSITARCFSFIYAKGATDESYLRVWLLYKIAGLGKLRVLLYEDVSFHKVIKKLLLVNLFVPFDFQIAFEGRSKTILHGVIILNTNITSKPCKGIGLYSNVNQVQIAPTPSSGGGISTVGS